MIEEIKIILLAIIQGITEFLPISSSGHIVLFESLFGSMDSDITIEVILHFGTLVSILYFFRADIWILLKGLILKQKDKTQYFIQVCLATIPAVVFVLLMQIIDFKIESLFNINTLIYTYFFNTIILLAIRNYKNGQKIITYKLAIFMGLSQVFALLPGISRAGITICSALLLGYDQKTAAKFSFFMAIPAMLGALVFKIDDILYHSSFDLHLLVLGFIFSLITGLLVLKLLFKILEGRRLWMFAIYSFVIWVSVISLVYNG